MANLKHLEKDVDSSKATVARLEAEHEKAQAFYDGTVEARRAVLLDESADQKSVNAAGAKADSAFRALEAVEDALQIAKTRAAESEANLASAKDQESREQRASEIREQRAKLERAWSAVDWPLAELLSVLQTATNCPGAARWANEVAAFHEALGQFGIKSVLGSFDSMAGAALQGGGEQTTTQAASVWFRAIGVSR
jgi:hypothetical protein